MHFTAVYCNMYVFRTKMCYDVHFNSPFSFSLAKRDVGRKSRESLSCILCKWERYKFWTEILFPLFPFIPCFLPPSSFFSSSSFSWNSLLPSLFRTFLSSRLCSSLLQTRVEMQAGSARVACDLWRSRSFVNVLVSRENSRKRRRRRRRRRRGTRRRKESSRIRVTCDSLCT